MVRKHLVHEGAGTDPHWLEHERRLLETVSAHRRVFVPGGLAHPRRGPL